MKDLIKKILEADEETKNNEESIERLKIESSRRIEYALDKRREEYIDKARMNIKVIKKIEDSKASIEIDKIRSECDHLLNKIDNEYSNHKDEWIDKIFHNIVSLDFSDVSLKNRESINE